MGLTRKLITLRGHWSKRFKGVFLKPTGWLLALMHYRLLISLMKPRHFPCPWTLCSHRPAILTAFWLYVIKSKAAGFIANALAYFLLLPGRKQALIRLRWRLATLLMPYGRHHNPVRMKPLRQTLACCPLPCMRHRNVYMARG